MSIPDIGSLCLGLFVGWLAPYVVRRLNKITPTTLGTVLSAIFGSIILNFIAQSGATDAAWYYPIGLFIGLILSIIMGIISIKAETKHNTLYPDTPISYRDISYSLGDRTDKK